MDKSLNLIKELTDLSGISSFEDEVKFYMKEQLSDFTSISSDNLGSLICKKEGSEEGPKIMLAGHMDEIGFMVNSITEKGFIKFIPIGGWWDQVLLAQRVIIKTQNGDVPGVIGSTPPHLLGASDKNKVVEKDTMFIDVGAIDKEDALTNLAIKPGDMIVPDSSFQLMRNTDFVMAKALDNRLGCALVIDILQELKNEDHPNTLYGVGTVQEEVGLRGAGTSAYKIEPDLAFALDVGIAGDTPGLESKNIDVELGKGPIILLADSSMLPQRDFRDFVINTAKKENIPIQYSTMMGGGTDAGTIHRVKSGIPSISICIPTRYIHSHTSVFNFKDYQYTKKLLISLIKNLDAATVDLLKK